MKKKNLKSLSLNKSVISNLTQNQINGGEDASIAGTFLTLDFCITDSCVSTVYEGPMLPTCAFC